MLAVVYLWGLGKWGYFYYTQRRSTSDALVPPKPKLLDKTVVSVASREVVTKGSVPTAGSGTSTLAEPAMN